MGKLDYAVGTKFYKYDTQCDEVMVFRILRQRKENRYVLKNETLGNLAYFNKDELIKSFIRLIPDGIITLTIGSIGEKNLSKYKDTVVRVYKYDDLIVNKNIFPAIICRQNMVDIFSYNDYENEKLGCSMSKSLCPDELDYKVLGNCKSVDSMELIMVYLDDTIDTIMPLIHASKYDRVLKEYKKFMLSFANDPIPDIANVKYTGLCESLKELLSTTTFMEDFESLFDITKVDIKIEFIDKMQCLTPLCLEWIEKSLGCNMFNHACLLYNKKIMLSEIVREYKLIKDITNTIYIIIYDSKKIMTKYSETDQEWEDELDKTLSAI